MIPALCLLMSAGLRPVIAEEEAAAEHFSANLRVLSYGVAQGISNSSQNPDNNFLQLPDSEAILEFRPDLRLLYDPFEISAKPRMVLSYSHVGEGIRNGDEESKDQIYMNEWLARWKARENLYLSYGRENTQWGPSFLFSPSNPFFLDNGRRNPILEVPGMDFGRLVWILQSDWTFSFIANTDEGRNIIIGPGPFERSYALKLDYTGRENYASAILTYREDGRESLGFFGGWTFSDAVLLYAEGAATRHDGILYPESDQSPLGISMVVRRSDFSPSLLLGGSYTFAGNGTLTLEGVYYAPGYSHSEAERYFELRQRAATAFGMTGPISDLGYKTLADTINPGLRLLRRYYALLQYTQTNILNAIDLTLRWTQNIEDGSGQFITYDTYSIREHLELFVFGLCNLGRGNTEFGSILDWQAMIGLKFTL
jgi:hypothetical protein